MTESGNGTEGIAESGTGIVAGIVKTFGDVVPGGTGAGRSAVVTARGTADGLVLRVESSVSRDALRKGLWDFMESRRNFIAGNELIIEWTHDKPEDAFIASLQAELATEFEVTFKDPAGKDLGAARAEIFESGAAKPKVPSLFDGIEALGINPGSSGSAGLSGGVSANVGFDRRVECANERSGRSAQPAAVWDEADTRIIYGTLRSGQKVETEHSLVVVGDVNSGAEIIAGGDVIVLGCLRGIAHAGAYDESGGGRTIFALNLQPTQLRIGGVITRGGASEGYAGPELARVDGAMIIVEAYQSRGMTPGKGSAKKN
jgi:septum formation inhibitor MinC